MAFYEGLGKGMVTSIGSGLIDYLVNTNDLFIRKIGATKGGMTLVDMAVINDVLEKISEEPIVIPGGAACNTAVGLGQLGNLAKFVGKVGNDARGLFFKNALIDRNVKPFLLNSELDTGKVLSMITPDGQRTMLTCLGASSNMVSKDIIPKYFVDSKIVHIEGYLLFNVELMFSVLEASRNAGALISLDLASFTVVEENYEILKKIINKYVDILFGNEDEGRAYTGLNQDKDIVSYMSENVGIAVLKVGERGSYIAVGNDIFVIPSFPIKNVIDTTGAGDLWASGFLFGLLNDFSIENSGKIASICGAEVCKIIGADISNDSWERIKNMISKF